MVTFTSDIGCTPVEISVSTKYCGTVPNAGTATVNTTSSSCIPYTYIGGISGDFTFTYAQKNCAWCNQSLRHSQDDLCIPCKDLVKLKQIKRTLDGRYIRYDQIDRKIDAIRPDGWPFVSGSSGGGGTSISGSSINHAYRTVTE